MQQLDDIERVFQDITNQSNVKTLDIVRSKDYEGNYEAKLLNAESYLSTLKANYIMMETNSLFLENLAKDFNEWPSTEEVEEANASKKAEYKEDKTLTEDLESEIDDLANTIQTKHELLKEKLVALETKLTSVKDKKKEYESLKEKSEERLKSMKEKETSRDSLKELEEKQLQADFAIKQCNGAISSLEYCIGLMRTEVNKLRGHVGELKLNLQATERHKQQTDQEEQDKMKWWQSAVDLLQSLEGMTVKEIRDDSLLLELNGRQCTSDQRDIPLLLTLTFQLCAIKPRLSGAEIDFDSMPIDDLVQSAVATGDVVALVHNVRRRYKSYQALRHEIEELQRNYAMDWEPGLSRIRVMLGRSGKTVCTLTIGSLYPAQDSVTLLKVESEYEQPRLDSLRPSSSSTSLSDWIKYLQEVFSSE